MQVLNETALVETFNLKAAIEYQLKNCELIATIATPLSKPTLSFSRWGS